MGKLAKPQRSKKHKKLKSCDPFYVGSRKDARSEGCNQKPKNFEQEVPKKLRQLGFSVDGVRSGRVGKKSRNKFQKFPDAPHKYNNQFTTPLGAQSGPKKDKSSQKPVEATPKPKQKKRFKKGGVPKISEEEISNYIDNMKPSRPFVEPFQFKKENNETDSGFMRRVNDETKRVINLTQISDKLEASDEKKMLMGIKSKKGMSDKKKDRLREKKKKKVLSVREKKQEKLLDFASLQDKVEFGDVVHAPPVLSVRPKKAVLSDMDRPGLRMPELKAVMDGNRTAETSAKSSKTTNPVSAPIKRKIGQSVKRKSLSSVQRYVADSQREKFIGAYRQWKLTKRSDS